MHSARTPVRAIKLAAATRAAVVLAVAAAAFQNLVHDAA
jgi:hypothetical protein